jgi:hypothetical protein
MTDQQTINNFNAYSIPICSQQPKGKKKKKKKKPTGTTTTKNSPCSQIFAIWPFVNS